MTNPTPKQDSTASPAIVDTRSPHDAGQSSRTAEQRRTPETRVIADPLAEETRSFWRTRGRALVTDTPKATDDAAKLIVTVAGIVVGFYVNSILRADFANQVQIWWLKVFFVAPILVLIISIFFGLWVLVPQRMDININSSRAGKLAHEIILDRKLSRFVIAFWSLIAGIVLLSTALVAYFLGS